MRDRLEVKKLASGINRMTKKTMQKKWDSEKKGCELS